MSSFFYLKSDFVLRYLSLIVSNRWKQFQKLKPSNPMSSFSNILITVLIVEEDEQKIRGSCINIFLVERERKTNWTFD